MIKSGCTTFHDQLDRWYEFIFQGIIKRINQSFKVLSNESGSLLLVKSYMNNEDWYSYKSLSFKILDCLNRGSVWLLCIALCVVRIALFCSNSVLCTTDWQALPHAKIPYVRCGWMSAKYSVLSLSTGKICLTCLMEKTGRDSLLLMCLK